MMWIGTGPRRDVWDKVCGATEACEAGFDAGYEGPAVAAGKSGAGESRGSAAMERDNADQSRGEQRGRTGRGRAGRTGIRGGSGIRGTTGWPPWRKKDWSSSSSDESDRSAAILNADGSATGLLRRTNAAATERRRL